MCARIEVKRFHLVVRTEIREMRSYGLVFANKDGNLGPQLQIPSASTAFVALIRVSRQSPVRSPHLFTLHQPRRPARVHGDARTTRAEVGIGDRPGGGPRRRVTL